MTERDVDAPEYDAARIDRDESGDHPTTGDVRGSTATDVRRYVNYAVLAGLLLVALVAAFQFYFAVSSTITEFVSPAYRAPFRAAFNLAVLLAVGAAVAYQLDRIRD